MTARRPGRLFWLSTFVIGVFSPGKGKRRINRRMQELHDENKSERGRNLSLTSEVKFLRGELYRVTGEHNTFLVQDDMNGVLRNMPSGSDTQTTIPLPTVNEPLAKATCHEVVS